MKSLILFGIFFLLAFNCFSGILVLGSNINTGLSRIELSRSEYSMQTQNSTLFELELKYFNTKNIIFGFGLNFTNIKTSRKEGLIDIALHFTQFNVLLGKHFEKSNTNTSVGFYSGFLNHSRISSQYTTLNPYINSSFKKFDYGILVNLQQKIYGWNTIDLGINAGGTYSLNNVYNPEIYPLGGWSKTGQRAKILNLFVGIFLHIKIEQ